MDSKLKALHSIPIDDRIKDDISRRLNRIEGQIKGLKRMVDTNRYCVEILTQMSSVQEALRGVGKAVLQKWLENCTSNTSYSRERAQAERTYKEIMDLIYKYAK